MNILLVSEVYLPTVSGVATSTDSIARFMASRGHTVHLVCPKPLVSYNPAKVQGLTISYVKSWEDRVFVGKPMTIFPIGFLTLRNIIRNTHIDIMHIQEPGALGISAIVLSKVYRIPTVGAMHFSLIQITLIVPKIFRLFAAPFMRLYIQIIYPLYTAIMVPTESLKNDAKSIVPHTPMHAISNGVDTNLYTPKKNVKKRKKTSFLYLGRLDSDKNIETILNAYVKCSPSIALVLAGVGKQEKLLQQQANELGINAKIRWIHELNQEAIIKLYQDSDCFVIMSPVETQSIVALQALACGLPVIAANAGALPELVQDRKNGYVLDTYDSESLAKKMQYLADHPDVRKKMGIASRKISLTHHKPTVLKKLEALYQSLCR